MIEIPREVLASAPRVWIEHGPGMRSRVIDPAWRRRKLAELEANALIAAQRDAARLAAIREDERRAAIEARAAENDRLRLERKRRRAKRDRDARADGMRAMRLLVETIAQQHDVTGAEVRGPRRFDYLTAPRQHVAYELRRAGLSLTTIGGLLRRDHTTVLASIRRWPVRARGLGIACEPLPAHLAPTPKVSA